MRFATALIASALIGCRAHASPDSRMAVPALDSVTVPLDSIVARTITEADLVRILGRPTDRRTGQGLSGRDVFVRYPIRLFAGPTGDAVIARAAILRVVFDAQGQVSDWFFVEPRGNQRLAVAETLEEARLWEQRELCKQAPRLVQLSEALQPGRADRAAVERLLAPFQPDRGLEEGASLPFPRKSRASGSEVWDYDADRPSPLFIPSRYLEMVVDSRGLIRLANTPGGMGGCVGT